MASRTFFLAKPDSGGCNGSTRAAAHHPGRSGARLQPIAAWATADRGASGPPLNGCNSMHCPRGIRVRLTLGQVPLQDDQFATLAQRAALIAGLASGAIILMLWFAVRSPLLIASILVTTLAGLVTATGLGLALFHRFNVISVAFIPLFVGMGMDFGIQFSVRYRVEHCTQKSVWQALVATGRIMGRSLTLAAAAIGVGFLAFAPTSVLWDLATRGDRRDSACCWRSLWSLTLLLRL